MARPNQETIDTFMSITGATEAVAVQRLEEHHGNLNQAVDAFFSEGDRNVVQQHPTVPEDDFMEVDDPSEIQHRQTSSLHSATGGLNPFSLLDPNFSPNLFDSRGFFTNSTDRTSFVSHPREVGAIPIEVKDDNRPSSHGPTIEDVTDTERTLGPEIRGSVSINDEDEENISAPVSYTGNQNERRDRAFHSPRPSAPEMANVPDYSNDIEEQMIRAAIEASKKDAELQHSCADNDLNNTGAQQRGDFAEVERAVSLSLKAAEQERALHEQSTNAGASGPRGSKLVDVDYVGSTALQKERQGTSQFMKGAGSSSIQDEVEELEEPPLVRVRSGHVSSSSVGAQKEDVGTEVSPPLSPPQQAAASQPQGNGHAFPDEWGGISSEEHDEAVMLEAAMFGGIPEDNRFHFAYAPHQLMRSGSRAAPRPPSPGLTAQRLIREQQDDEYLASLQADREKELKAIQELETARQAALEENRRKEEAARCKLEEEQELERQLTAKEASLPEEPAADHENTVTLLVKMPDGSRRGRRFLKTDRLQSLFDFIDVGKGVKPGTYRVVRPYPRRAFSAGEGTLTLEELGLTSKQEALFLESI